MKKSILNLVGARELTTDQQKSINGGSALRCIPTYQNCTSDSQCTSLNVCLVEFDSELGTIVGGKCICPRT